MCFHVTLGHAKALSRAWLFALDMVAIVPANQYVGQVILRVLLGCQRSLRDRAELFV